MGNLQAKEKGRKGDIKRMDMVKIQVANSQDALISVALDKFTLGLQIDSGTT